MDLKLLTSKNKTRKGKYSKIYE